MYAVPVMAAGFGVFIARTQFKLKEIGIPVRNLPADLDGLRIVQLSDIHLGPFLEERELDRVIDMANETRAHVAVVTGDIITSVDDLLTKCLERLTRLRAEAGVLGCLGNHEFVAECEVRAKREGALLDLDFLRGESRQLRFGSANLNIVGVDHQHRSHRYLTGVGALVRPGETNILLSHNPDVFPVAADLGFDVTLAGHTHGGQVTAEILSQHLNLARFLTPYVYGPYQRDSSSIYVTSGIGTVGIPARIGASPEVALIRLCAT
jgi:predicted MPP superfamily phosphohydrolase